jgi:hypothetical protein
MIYSFVVLLKMKQLTFINFLFLFPFFSDSFFLLCFLCGGKGKPRDPVLDSMWISRFLEIIGFAARSLVFFFYSQPRQRERRARWSVF